MKQIVDTLMHQSLEVDHQKKTEPFTDMVVSHYHPSFEIYYLVEGERIYFVKDQSYIVNKGDFVFIPPNIIHKTLSSSNYAHERILISFDASYIDKMTKGLTEFTWLSLFTETTPVIKLPLAKKAMFQELMFRILAVSQEKHSDSVTYVKLLILELLLLLQRFKENNKDDNDIRQSPAQQKVFEIVRYINETYMEDLSLKSISDRFYISPYYLSHIFKSCTGFTFCDYLIQLRVLEAKKLLTQTGLSMTDIAQSVGFDSSTHFGRTFKKASGVTPSDYRKNSRLR